MDDDPVKSHKITGAGLRLVKIYIATALVVWKSIGYYIDGTEGLWSNFNASPWSLAIGWGYVLGVLILFSHAVIQFQSKQYRDMTQALVLAGLGLLLLTLEIDFPSLAVSFFGALAVLGLNGLMVYYSLKGLRWFKSRAFVYWFWGYSINLVAEIGMKCYTETGRSASGALVMPAGSGILREILSGAPCRSTDAGQSLRFGF